MSLVVMKKDENMLQAEQRVTELQLMTLGSAVYQFWTSFYLAELPDQGHEVTRARFTG